MGIIACLNFLNQIYQMGRKLSRLISGGVNLKIGKKHSITYFLIFILTACERRVPCSTVPCSTWSTCNI